MKAAILATIMALCACNNSMEPEIRTVEVIKHDTVNVEIVRHDTVTMVSTPNKAGELDGVWTAKYGGRYQGSEKDKPIALVMAFTPPSDYGDSLIFKEAFTASRIDGDFKTSISGYIESESGGLCTVYWGGKRCSWALSFKGGKLFLQEIGDGFFLTTSAVEFAR